MKTKAILTGKLFYLTLVLILTNHFLMAQTGTEKSPTLKNKVMKQFTLPELPYSADALEPIISKSTIEYHHGKHLQTYINNLNNLIIGTKLEGADLETIVKNSDGATFNNAAQTWNHVLYFNTFSPKAKQHPEGNLLKAIEKEWGSFDNFKKEFAAAGNSIFGSGWVWLAQTPEGKLVILKESNAGNPLTKGYNTLLGIDVWEHSYYLDYQNRRADHLNALWTIIDWNKIEPRYNATAK